MKSFVSIKVDSKNHPSRSEAERGSKNRLRFFVKIFYPPLGVLRRGRLEVIRRRCRWSCGLGIVSLGECVGCIGHGSLLGCRRRVLSRSQSVEVGCSWSFVVFLSSAESQSVWVVVVVIVSRFGVLVDLVESVVDLVNDLFLEVKEKDEFLGECRRSHWFVVFRLEGKREVCRLSLRRLVVSLGVF